MSTATAKAHRTDTLAELMAAMGSKEGFDPMPPSQHTFLLDLGESNAARAIAWVWSKTIRPGKGHRRTPHAHDERGDLTTKQAAADLGWAHSNTIAAFNKLADQGRIRIDDGKRIFLKGDAPQPRRTEDEDNTMEQDEENDDVICHNNLPTHLRLYFQSLNEKESQKALSAYFRVQRFKKAIVKDALAIAREKADEVERSYYQQIGYSEPEEHRGRPKLERVSPVQLSLERVPDFFVDITENEPSLNFEHNLQVISSEPETGSEQITHPYVAEKESMRVSEWKVPEQPESSETPPTHELTSEEIEGDAEIASVLESVGFETDSLKFVQFATLPKQHQIPARSVCRAIVAKVEQKREQGKPIYNAGALYEFVKTDLPTWIRQHPRELEYDRKLAAHTGRSPDAGKPATMNEEQRKTLISLLESNLEMFGPTHEQYAEWERELDTLRRTP